MPAPEAIVFLVGNELTEGRLQDKNGYFLAQELSEVGFKVREIRCLPDDKALLRESFAEALASPAQVVLSSGGLGHTSDDLTAAVWAEVLDDELYLSEELLLRQQERLRSLGRASLPYIEKYALAPRRGEALWNPVGLAPALLWEKSLRIICALPGPPAELRALWQGELRPRLIQRFGPIPPFRLTLRTTGLTESRLSALLAEWEGQLPSSFHVAYNPSWEGVSLHVQASPDTDPTLFVQQTEALRQRLSSYLYGEGSVSLAEAVLALCREKGYTLSVAESCTGGHITAALVDVPGASDVLKGGIVSYANAVKVSVLGVSEKVLATEGAVSESVAKAMAEGVREVTGATVGIATTGIAGPTGGSAEKPVGTVWFGLALPDQIVARRLVFPGDRQTVIGRATATALSLLWQGLRGMVA